MNNIVEQDHRFMKRRGSDLDWTLDQKPTAWWTIQEYETIQMIRKGQIEGIEKGDIQGQNQFITELFGLTVQQNVDQFT